MSVALRILHYTMLGIDASHLRVFMHSTCMRGCLRMYGSRNFYGGWIPETFYMLLMFSMRNSILCMDAIFLFSFIDVFLKKVQVSR